MPSSEVPAKFKARTLHSGGPKGKVVTNPKQMIAILLSEKKKEDANGGVYPESNPLAGKRRKRS